MESHKEAGGYATMGVNSGPVDPANFKSVEASMDWGQKTQIYLANTGQIGHAVTLLTCAFLVSPFSKERLVLVGPLVNYTCMLLAVPSFLCNKVRGEGARREAWKGDGGASYIYIYIYIYIYM